IDVLGVRVDDVTIDESVEVCRASLRSRGSHRIVTPNAEIVMAARADAQFRATLNGSTLSIPDGAGLLLAGRLLGTPLRAQVTGTDLCYRLAALSAERGYRLFLLGAQPGVAAAAAAALERRYPGLKVAGTFPGRAGPEGDT